MRGRAETAAYMLGMARVFSMKGENTRQEACERAAEMVRRATDRQALVYALRGAERAQDLQGNPYAASAYGECVTVVYEFIR